MTVVEEARSSSARVALIAGWLMTPVIVAMVAFGVIRHDIPLVSSGVLILPAITVAMALYGVLGMRKAKARERRLRWLQSMARPITPEKINAKHAIFGGGRPQDGLTFTMTCTFVDPRGNIRDTKRRKYNIDSLSPSSNIPSLAADIYVNPDDFEEYAVVLYRLWT